MRKYVFIIFLFFANLPGYSQVDLDSLWGVWHDETVPDANRAQAMLDIVKYGYLYSQPDSGFYYAEIAYEFASIMGLKKEMASALILQGGSYWVRSDFQKAKEYYLLCVDICEEISFNDGMARALNNIGVIYSIQGDYAHAMAYHQRSLKIKAEISDTSGMAGSMNNMGLIYMNHGDYPHALYYFQKSLKIKEQFSDNRGVAQILNNIGLIYLRQEDTTKALECFMRSYKICDEISDKKGIAGILSNIGLIYMDQKDYSQALDCYQQSLLINEEISDIKGIADTYNNLGEIYSHQSEYPMAMEYYQKSLKIYEDISDKKGLAGVLNNIGVAYSQQNLHPQAIKWCNESLKVSEEIDLIEDQRSACKCLYLAHKNLGNDKQALVYHERIALLNDSLQTEETSKKLQEMEFSRQMLADSLRQEEEKLRVQLGHESEVRKKIRLRNIFFISAVFLLIGAIGIYRRMNFVRKAKKEIEHEKDRSDNLLLNILPSEIAEELKEKGKADARRFEKASILFTDFKQFTEISQKLSPEDLVDEINTCFKQFDAICSKYGIEKIKTIGDSYMAAGGIPIPSDDSVKKTILAAIEMTEFLLKRQREEKSKERLCFEMRVGIHTGPVVAGIVGVSKFQYDIWGETVNIASRIENSGEVGKVNISHYTYELIKNDQDFKFIPRGKVYAKGKGDIEMWFVGKATM